MDLTKTYPRSPRDKMLGIYSLKRSIDKAKAYNDGKLGEYHYDCPHDRPLFDFLGANADQFAQKVKELDTDDKIADWAQRSFLSKKSPEDIERFNQDRLHWHPDPGTPSYDFFMKDRERLAPGRNDIVTWFDLLDLDEGRPVSKPTQLVHT